MTLLLRQVIARSAQFSDDSFEQPPKLLALRLLDAWKKPCIDEGLLVGLIEAPERFCAVDRPRIEQSANLLRQVRERPHRQSVELASGVSSASLPDGNFVPIRNQG